MAITLIINDRPKSIDAPGDMPLLWVIRDLVGLTGTKYGCGRGICGACTVLLDQEAIRSCVTPLSSVQGRQITTIEGLQGAAPHPVQQAWIDHDVAQCGYCQPGQIMAAVGLLKRTPTPSDEQIREAMSGNICRCGTYARILAAIRDAAARTGDNAHAQS